MRRQLATTLVAALGLAAVLAAQDARAQRARATSRGGEFSFRLESEGGRVLPTYHYRGHTYVEGTRGRRYVIRVFNHTAERVEAVVTVDGRDVITDRKSTRLNSSHYS